MKTSRLLLVSVFIAVVLLVVMGGAASAVLKPQPTQQDEIQTYQQREAEYQALIQQANQQIEQANADLQILQEQLTSVQAQPASAPPDAPANAANSTLISPDAAATAARQAAGEDQFELNQPELVNFEGKTAYEVPFDSGSIYVDALSGEVLFNGTLPLTIDQEQAVEIAMEYFNENENDVVMADQITFRGEPLFRVVFKSRLMVYIDTSGQIQYAQYAVLKSQADYSDDGDYSSDGGSGGYDDEYEDEHEDEHEEGD